MQVRQVHGDDAGVGPAHHSTPQAALVATANLVLDQVLRELVRGGGGGGEGHSGTFVS